MRGAGEVIFHGLGVRPGETGALGLIGGRPVLALPGRFDAALGVWLTIGRMLMRQLTAEMPGAPPRRALTRKISSAAGLAEVVLVRESADGAEPLGAGMFAASALAAATGWVLVPPESEGYAKGTMVDVHPLP
jgi:molybdopterin biosynthesis enzyme